MKDSLIILVLLAFIALLLCDRAEFSSMPPVQEVNEVEQPENPEPPIPENKLYDADSNSIVSIESVPLTTERSLSKVDMSGEDESIVNTANNEPPTSLDQFKLISKESGMQDFRTSVTEMQEKLTELDSKVTKLSGEFNDFKTKQIEKEKLLNETKNSSMFNLF